jgi:hypothetical protein
MNGTSGASLKELPVFSINKLADDRTKTLADCLRGNHNMFTVLRDPYLIFHNHMPHVSPISIFTAIHQKAHPRYQRFWGQRTIWVPAMIGSKPSPYQRAKNSDHTKQCPLSSP